MTFVGYRGETEMMIVAIVLGLMLCLFAVRRRKKVKVARNPLDHISNAMSINGGPRFAFEPYGEGFRLLWPDGRPTDVYGNSLLEVERNATFNLSRLTEEWATRQRRSPLKIAVLALLALLPFQMEANTISFTDSDAQTFGPGGYHIDFSGAFDVPLFDSSLGTLNSISYVLTATANASWNVLYRYAFPLLTDTNSSVSFSFLGGSYGFSMTNDTTNGPPCGPGAQPYMGFEPVAVCPTIGSEQAHFTNAQRVITDIDSYIGQGSISLPVTVSVDFSNNFMFQPKPAIISIGDLAAARAGGFLTWTYNYTAAPFVDPPTVTPEPRTSACLAGLIGLLLIGRRLLKHIPAAPPFV